MTGETGREGLSLQYHLELAWVGVALDQFLERLILYVSSVVIPLARMIGRAPMP